MLAAQLILFGCAALISVLFSARYLLARAYFPYHAFAAGRDWHALDPGVQQVILAMMRVIGGGLLGSGVACGWFMLALYGGAPWAPVALLSVSAATTVPILCVAVSLRRFAPGARTPVVPAAAALAVVIVGAGLPLLR